jgi:hypothetical protein
VPTEGRAAEGGAGGPQGRGGANQIEHPETYEHASWAASAIRRGLEYIGPMLEENQFNTDLLYPFYLDTDMTMAYAAALAGGVAMKTESVDTGEKQVGKSGELRAGLRLFDILDFGGKGKISKKEAAKSESRIIRHHTEASIFITLFRELTSLGAIAEPVIDELSVGQLISIEIGPAKAPLLRVVDQILRLLDLFSPEAESKSVPGTSATAIIPGGGDSSVEGMRTLFRSLRGDLEFSGMTDIVVKDEDRFNVLLTLDNRFVTEQALEILHTSSSRVVGKVTQIWRKDTDIINLFRRSVLSLLPALSGSMGYLVLGMLHSLAKTIDLVEVQRQVNESMGIEEYDPVSSEITIGDDFQSMLPAMNGPAIQILPLAVCA